MRNFHLDGVVRCKNTHCIGLLTMWSIVAVEVIHPINRDLQIATGAHDDCQDCLEAFSSVWEANITFFYCVVLGDDWGSVILPIIKYHESMRKSG